MKVKMSSFEPRFVGSGFYETDYKKKNSVGEDDE